jgi:hypothetical protein
MTWKKSHLIGAAFAGFVAISAIYIGFSFLMSTTNSLPQLNKRVSKSKKAFELIVALTFKSPEDKETFKGLFSGVASYVSNHEPTTLSYELAESDNDPLRVVIFERYVNKVRFVHCHR